MAKLSLIILSYTIDDDIYLMNCRCLDSLFASEEWSDGELEVLLVESKKEAGYQYDSRVRVIVPNEKFGFHRFFNIGLEQTKGEFVAFCNNDIIFQSGWWSAIMKVKREHPRFMCFSPVDSHYPMMEEEIAKGKEYIVGWENKRHFAAWCFVWERKVFDTIGRFDETFDFYGADDDELQTLRSYAIPNVLVRGSVVQHLSQIVTKKVNKDNSPAIPVEKRNEYPLTEEEIRRNMTWLWDDIRLYQAYRRLQRKWGHWRMVGRVDRFLTRHPLLYIRPISRLMYRRSINILMAKILRMKW